MAQTFIITCIHKIPRSDRYHAIESVGGLGWKMTQQQAVNLIDLKFAEFFVENGLLSRVKVIAETSQFGHRYLKTEADSVLVDNLLNLPECP